MSAAGELRCERMTRATLPGALAVLQGFLGADAHYLDSSAAYGDAGPDAGRRALELFLERPQLGFVWVARQGEDVLASCVVCFAISTSRGGLVAKLDDVSVAAGATGQGIGSLLLERLKAHLRTLGVSRIDCGCHRDNEGAWRFYARHGFVPLHEERIACLLAD